MASITDPTTRESQPQQTAPVTLRLVSKAGRCWDAVASDERMMRAQVIEFQGLVFLFSGDDRRDGVWLRLYRQVEVVCVQAASPKA